MKIQLSARRPLNEIMPITNCWLRIYNEIEDDPLVIVIEDDDYDRVLFQLQKRFNEDIISNNSAQIRIFSDKKIGQYEKYR
jgi:hypothetical protein